MKETFYKISGCPVRFALLTDFHNCPPAPILRSLRKRRPDMIAIAGDVVYGSRPGSGLIVQKQENVLPFLRSCSSIAPTYLSLGNHEMRLCTEDMDLIADTGVKILDNAWTTTENDVVIGGLTSAYVLSYRRFRNNRHTEERYPADSPSEGTRDRLRGAQPEKPDTGWLRDYADVPGYHILLSHHPEYISLIPSSIELICSGHAHGGQWNYYSFRQHRWKGILAPGQGLFPEYTSGIYGHMVVSRGLANTARVPRILNPTEIVYIHP